MKHLWILVIALAALMGCAHAQEAPSEPRLDDAAIQKYKQQSEGKTGVGSRKESVSLGESTLSGRGGGSNGGGQGNGSGSAAESEGGGGLPVGFDADAYEGAGGGGGDLEAGDAEGGMDYEGGTGGDLAPE